MRKPPKKRDYRKLHLVVDANSGDVVGVALTSKRATDASCVPSLLKQVTRAVASACADSAYDTTAVYEALENHHPDRSPVGAGAAAEGRADQSSVAAGTQ